MTRSVFNGPSDDFQTADGKTKVLDLCSMSKPYLGLPRCTNRDRFVCRNVIADFCLCKFAADHSLDSNHLAATAAEDDLKAIGRFIKNIDY